MVLAVDRFVLPVGEQPGFPALMVEVKRYTSPLFSPSRGQTLLLTHGVSYPKELWEPTLSRLFELQSHHSAPLHIREAWAIDCPSHGASAALNDHVLGFGYTVTYKDYERAVTAFLSSGLIDLNSHSLIAIGHSGGSAPLAGAADTWFQKISRLPFRSLILVEPSMISAELDAKYSQFNAALAVKAHRRRRHWTSRAEAIRWLGKRQPFWDPRCLRLFAEYGLRNTRLPSREVTLSCTSAQEAACYSVEEQEESLAVLARLCPILPIHTIFSEIVDLSPHPEVQDNLVDERQGRKMASVTRMPGVGHFAPFQNPETCARAIFHSLRLACLPAPSPGHHAFASARL